jgi:hypothetical protein
MRASDFSLAWSLKSVATAAFEKLICYLISAPIRRRQAGVEPPESQKLCMSLTGGGAIAMSVTAFTPLLGGSDKCARAYIKNGGQKL